MDFLKDIMEKDKNSHLLKIMNEIIFKNISNTPTTTNVWKIL